MAEVWDSSSSSGNNGSGNSGSSSGTGSSDSSGSSNLEVHSDNLKGQLAITYQVG